MGKENVSQGQCFDFATHQCADRCREGQNRKKLITERPLGTIFEILEEPEPGFVDVEGEADMAACVWERSECESGKTVNGRKLI